jgi:toxin-antitoxin system PIN domain toxin
VAAHLLDVNALIALIWEDHQFHDAMAGWFSRHATHGWATCAITQSGFIRVMSQPALAKPGRTVADLADTLKQNLSHPRHRLLPLDFDFAEVQARCSGGVVGHRQVSDAYLLTAAIRAGMKLLTFDRGVGALLASDAERAAHLEVLR